MRNLFLITFLFFSVQVFALEYAQFPTHAPRPGDFEGQFVIGAADEIEVIKLDCASFIQGIFFFHVEDGELVQKGLFSLSNQECVDVYVDILKAHDEGNGLCMQVDIEKQYFEYRPNDGDCDIDLEVYPGA